MNLTQKLPFSTSLSHSGKSSLCCDCDQVISGLTTFTHMNVFSEMGHDLLNKLIQEFEFVVKCVMNA